MPHTKDAEDEPRVVRLQGGAGVPVVDEGCDPQGHDGQAPQQIRCVGLQVAFHAVDGPDPPVNDHGDSQEEIGGSHTLGRRRDRDAAHRDRTHGGDLGDDDHADDQVDGADELDSSS